MTTKHTPGPWYESKTGNHQGLVIAEKTGAKVAVTYDKADASLVAAAPNLLEALTALLECCYDIERNDETVAAVSAAWAAIHEAQGD